VVSGASAIALSFLWWSFLPVGLWLYLVIGSAICFLLVAALYGVTIWPLVLLLAKLFGQEHNRAEPNRAVPADAAKGPPRG
jgi:hypothetical protein